MAEANTTKAPATIGDNDIVTIADKLAAAFSEKVNTEKTDFAEQSSYTLNDYLEKSQSGNEGLANRIIDGFGGALDDSELNSSMNSIYSLYKNNKDDENKSRESNSAADANNGKDSESREAMGVTLKDISETQNELLSSIKDLTIPEQDIEKSLPEDDGSPDDDMQEEINQKSELINPPDVKVNVNLPEHSDDEYEQNDELGKLYSLMNGMITSIDKQNGIMEKLPSAVPVQISEQNIGQPVTDKEIPDETSDDKEPMAEQEHNEYAVPRTIDYTKKYDAITDSLKNVSDSIYGLSSALDSDVQEGLATEEEEATEENNPSDIIPSPIDISKDSIAALTDAMTDGFPKDDNSPAQADKIEPSLTDEPKDVSEESPVNSDETYSTENDSAINMADLMDMDHDIAMDKVNPPSIIDDNEVDEEIRPGIKNFQEKSDYDTNMPDTSSKEQMIGDNEPDSTNVDTTMDGLYEPEPNVEIPDDKERTIKEDMEREMPMDYSTVQMFQQSSLSDSDIKALADAIGKSVTDHLVNSNELHAYDAQYLDAVTDMTRRGKS